MQKRRIAVDVGLVVSDLEQALTFYRDLLNLPIIAKVTTSLIGKGQMVQLQHGESLIKLVEFSENPSQQNPKGISATVGYRYITLMVSNISTIMTRMEEAHVPTVQPLTQLGNGAAIAMVEDPDGNIVEFVQE